MYVWFAMLSQLNVKILLNTCKCYPMQHFFNVNFLFFKTLIEMNLKKFINARVTSIGQ